MNKLMVFRFSAMGDVAMTVPVLQALHQSRPDLEIIMVSKPFFAPFFKDLPNVKFIGVDVKKQYKGLIGLYRLLLFLKQHQPDAIADLHNVLRTKVLRLFFKLNGYKVAVIDKGRQEKRALTRVQNKVLKPLKTTPERYADVFRNLGFEVDLTSVKPLNPSLSTQTNLFLQTFEGQTLIGIAPFAAHKGKQYPLDKIKEVIRKLLAADSQINILLFGGGRQRKSLTE
jgi:ADP-heptose:LPS heptosyltransferase